nr:rabenosyn 5 [Hymenolepis microstoma]
MTEDLSFNYQDTIIEGFICPSCLKSFSKPELLEVHFAKQHFHTAPATNRPENFAKGPTLGTVCNRTADFEKLRKAQVDRNALETNLLLIRLEKLSNIPDNLDIAQLHIQEQSVVPWIEAKVNLCPRCGASFGLGWAKGTLSEDQATPISSQSQLLDSPPYSFTRRARDSLRSATRFAATLIDSDPIYRRMHHCRLCGHIICGDCSFFLSKDVVHRIIQACNWASDETLRNKICPSDVFKNNDADLFKPRRLSFLSSRSSSATSLDIVIPRRSKKNRPDVLGLRICEVCKGVLEDKMAQIEEKQSSPIGLEEFRALKSEMAKVREKMPLFSSMASSLNSGEEKYVLEIAKSLRMELLQSLHKIDEIGKAISSLDVTGLRSAGTQTRINQAMGKFACRFVQNNLTPLRVLPTVSEHRRLVQSRLRSLRFSATSSPIPSNEQIVRDADGGWMPSAPRWEMQDEDFDSSDPRMVLMRQMDLVADYLAQAQAARRSPQEIDNLTQNLADLEEELSLLSAAPK